MAAAVKLAQKLDQGVIVTIVCDRGDRYLSSDVFAQRNKKINGSPAKNEENNAWFMKIYFLIFCLIFFYCSRIDW